MARSFASRFVDNLGFAYRKIALLITDDESDDGSAPTLTAGSAAPSASENVGSLYVRTSNGAWYRRVGSSWELVLGTSGALTADTIAELTAAAGVTIDGLLLKDGFVAAADSQGVKFGNTAAAPDITVAWDATKLAFTQGTPNSAIHLGVSDAGIDLNLFGDTAGYDCTWDQSRDTLVFADNARLGFGSGGGAAYDIEILWNGTKLLVSQLTANSAIDFGVDGAGIDLVMYGDTASQTLTWDQSADALVMTAAVSITGQGSTVVPVIPIAAGQALAGSGAVNVASYYTSWDTTGGGAGTLANGAQKGQLKKVQLIVDGGDGTLTPTSLSGGTTITFADVGDFAILCWNGTAWVAIELGNDADGITAPVLA